MIIVAGGSIFGLLLLIGGTLKEKLRETFIEGINYATEHLKENAEWSYKE